MRTLSRGDFIETRRGDCRIGPSLARQLAETTVGWHEVAAPIAEQVAQAIAHDAPDALNLPTNATQTRRRLAAAARDTRGRPARRQLPSLPTSCRGCGAELADRRRRYCDACRRASAEVAAEQGRIAAAAALARLRDSGRDPAHGGDAARRRGRKNFAHQQAIAAWSSASGDSIGRDALRRIVDPSGGTP